jgi:23S rRNA pseudouridine2605 synthase
MKTNKPTPRSNSNNKGKRGSSKTEGSKFSKSKSPSKPFNSKSSSSKGNGKLFSEKSNSKFGKPFSEKGKSNFSKYSSDKGNNKYGKPTSESGTGEKKGYLGTKPYPPKRRYSKKTNVAEVAPKVNDGTTRLNKYISNSGVCSRREADTFIETGVVKVNGQIITELGYKVQPGDKVHFGDKLIRPEKNFYLLLNKPKDYITTSKDPQERKTVMQLISNFTQARVYPVGRLDRNTTGLLLLTNDGELADKLMHPRKKVKKIYHVELDKNLTQADFQKISEVSDLEDGPFQPDVLAYTGNGENKKSLGIEIHSGKNRIVRRLFEHYGYKVVKLDRVYFAGLTKKNLPRKEWRHLEESEVNMLKMI